MGQQTFASYQFDPFGVIGPDADAGLQRAAVLAARAFGARHAMVTIDVGSGLYVAAGTPDIERGFVDRASVPCTQVIAGEKPVVIADLAANPAFAVHQKLGKIYTGVPITAPSGVVVGALSIVDPRSPQIDYDELAVLGDYAKLADDALLRRGGTNRDPLTGVYTSSYLAEQAAVEWQRCARERRPLSVAMIDVDNFRAYNDAFGRNRGDIVLKKVARLMSAQFRRPGELVGRHEGREIALVLPGVHPIQAEMMLSDALRVLRRQALPHQGSDHGVVTFSAGVSGVMNAASADAEGSDLFYRADDALQDVKAHGGNNVRSWMPG
jgi:diguanylate cyclase (GGDEF)-like protein